MDNIPAGMNNNVTDLHKYFRFLRLQTSTVLLVPQWSTGSIFGLVGAMLAAIVASVTYQCMNEYLQHLRRQAITRNGGTICCGVEVVTVWEKLGQTSVQILRVICGYLMMYCVMTMNVWLLVSVVVGAAVGYGVGKPLVANMIQDSVTSHEYSTVRAQVFSHSRNRSERSKSWRYQPIQRPDYSHLKRDDEQGLSNTEVNLSSRYSERGDECTDVVWIRRSNEDLTSRQHDLSEVFDPSDTSVQTRHQEHFNSIKSTNTASSRSMSRFKSTSKVINESLLSWKSDIGSKYSSDSQLNTSFLRNPDRSSPGGIRKSGHVSRSASSSSTGRFKSVSKQIMKQLSFTEDLR